MIKIWEFMFVCFYFKEPIWKYLAIDWYGESEVEVCMSEEVPFLFGKEVFVLWHGLWLTLVLCLDKSRNACPFYLFIIGEMVTEISIV